MAKPVMLIVSMSSATSVGLKSYLNSIFGRYIHIETRLTDNVDVELMEAANLVLFASREAERNLRPLLTPEIRYLIARRTVNYTYLNRLLPIPSNSDVYLINDSESSAMICIDLLQSLGFTQYNFIPFYPGCQESELPVQYAVTVGEGHLVPAGIPTVIDIGVRIADISAISEIAAFFHLPMSLVDVVTQNYINQFVQLLKISNHQLSEATNTKFITQSIISNVNTGICIVDDAGYITMVNKGFIKAMEIRRSNLVGVLAREVVPELEGVLDRPRDQYSPIISINRSGVVRNLAIQELQDTGNRRMTMLHCVQTGSEPIRTKSIRGTFYRFKDYISVNEKNLRMLESAKRISLTDYRLLIQGEPGTGRTILAQAVHNNSRRGRGPFIKLNFSAMSEDQVLEELYPRNGQDGILKRAEGGTLYLFEIQHMSPRIQKEFFRIMDMKPDIRFIASTAADIYQLCREGSFMRELFYLINEVTLTTLPIRERPEDIPLLFEYFMRNIYNNPNLSRTEICSEGLWQRIMEYQWPGNGREIENLCKYFYCIRGDKRLMSRDLPPYILSQVTVREDRLSAIDRQVLQIIYRNPKTGRAGLQKLLQNQGIEISEGKIRNILSELAEQGLIKMNRTRGGCEVTEDGELMLQ